MMKLMKLSNLITLLIVLLTSCTSPSKLHRVKVNKAKDKINKLVSKYPELKSTSDTTYIKRDTIIESNTIINTDSIYVKGGVIVDTVIQFNDIDSIFYAKFEDITVKLEEMEGGQVRADIIREDNYIYYTDTIKFTDTIFVTNINTVKTNIINTKKSFWWLLWDNISVWIWWILIIVAILLIGVMIRKFVG